jgi:peptidoglycan/LPS O-acetylase OafA/YrhL
LYSQRYQRHFDTRSIQAAIITLLVCSSVAANSRLSRLLLANPVMLFIGRISYSIYIWQQLFLGPQSRPFLRSLSALPIKFAAIVVVASLSHFFIEKPFIQYGRTLLRKYSVADVNELLSRPANIVTIPAIQ